MLSLKCDIEIKCKDSKKTITFDYCNDILIKTSCKNLTDTAVLKVPRKMQWQGKALTDFVNVDDAIIIKLGYAEMGNMEMVFKGYIKSVENTIKEIVIYCENEMRLFKSINVDAEIIEHFDFKKWMKKYVPELRTRTAKQWTNFTSDPTANMLYPNLKWLPSRSASPREEHIPFYGLVLPKTDVFWQHNQPGNLWNCKCDWEETDEQPSSYIPKDIYAKGLEGNPAQTGQIFTDKASYINRAGKINLDEETAKQFKNLQNLIDANPKQWRVDYYTDNKGYLQTSRKRIEEGNINKQEKEKFAKEWNMCKVLADKDHTVIYRESVQGRFDIYLDGVPAELKTTANENNIVKYAKKAIIQQGAKIIVFRFDTPVTKLMWQELNKIKAKKWECYYFIKGDMDVKRL